MFLSARYLSAASRRQQMCLYMCVGVLVCVLQKLAVPSLLKGGDYLLTSHTGSGKTLAYLLPLVRLGATRTCTQRYSHACAVIEARDMCVYVCVCLLTQVHMLKRQEDDGFVPAPKRPRVLVVGPTKELTEQV